MRKIIIGLLMLFLLSTPVACAQPTQVPETEPEPILAQPPSLPAEDAIIEMSTVGTMSGIVKHLTISANGSIVYIEEEGPRIVLPGSERIRTTRTGQLSEEELEQLLKMVDACPFDAEGKCDARTEIIDTDAVSVLTVLYEGKTRTITANYQPLSHDVMALSDVPEPVRELYRQLKSIIDNNTSQVSEEAISKTE